MTESATAFLPDFTGPNYIGLLDRLHQRLRPKAYLEVGTLTGMSLRLAKCASIAIDPKLAISNAAFVCDKPLCALYQMESDDFFAAVDPTVVLGRKIDIAFLDGMHLSEFLFRDFAAAERFCNPKSIIALHDCLPLDHVMAERKFTRERKTQMHRIEWWTGDCWRFALLLKRRRRDLRILALATPPTGLILVTNLDPRSVALRDGYNDFVAEMRAMSLPEITLAGLHAALDVRPISALDEFEEAGRFN
jgi:predicted O-methyltransferase YrrM